MLLGREVFLTGIVPSEGTVSFFTEPDDSVKSYSWVWFYPVTTLWTQPSSCYQTTTHLSSLNWYVIKLHQVAPEGSFAQVPDNFVYNKMGDCLPPQFSGACTPPSVTTDSASIIFYYSSALCPAGWSDATQPTTLPSHGFSIPPPITNFFGTTSGSTLYYYPP